MDATIDWVMNNWDRILLVVLLFFIFAQTSIIPSIKRKVAGLETDSANILGSMERTEENTSSRLAGIEHRLDAIEGRVSKQDTTSSQNRAEY